MSEREGSQRERALLLPAPGRCVVMGVLNVTPDSFSDGGRYCDLDAAVSHGISLWREGADLVDVGGESTRPGADRVPADEETGRVVPPITALAGAGVPISVDTTRAAVAAAAIEAGASVVNDVSGGLADPDMARVVADAGVPWVLMHWRGHSRDMQELATYDDVVADVVAELGRRVDAAVAAGVDPARLVVDPGLGFAKTAEHNWALLARLDAVRALGLPVLVGTSRKSFLGRLLAGPDGAPRPVGEREDATVASTVLAVLAGAWGVRVHEVRRNLDAIRVAEAYRRARAAARAPAIETSAVGTPAGAGPEPAGAGPPAGAGLEPAGAGTPADAGMPAGAGAEPAGAGTPAGAGRAAGAGTPAGAGTGPDRIALRGLRVRGRHGGYAEERRTGQEFVVDAVLELDTAPAAAADDLARTVDYGALAHDLASVVAGEPVDLIETLADRLARRCLRDPRVTAAEVTVHKPAAPIPIPFDDVSVTVRRSR